MNIGRRFLTVLRDYNPKDKRCHSILRFFSEDLPPSEKAQFIKLIFDRGSWSLPTEISSLSDDIALQNETKIRFTKIFSYWVNERLDHSLSLSVARKNTFVPYIYKIQFREALMSTKNLGFPVELMQIFEKFVIECSTNYSKIFFEDSLWLIIEEFSTDEIEAFFSYYLDIYYKTKSNNLTTIFYVFLTAIASSFQIFNLSPRFIEKLLTLKSQLRKEEYKSNSSIFIAILLIDYIDTKNLDLSGEQFIEEISEILSNLEKGKHDNLEFFRFLKRFKYPFQDDIIKVELKFFKEELNNKIEFLKVCEDYSRKSIFYHYVKNADRYFELFLFYLENVNQNFVGECFEDFILIIDRLRHSFDSIFWYKEFLSFEPIPGQIDESINQGFNVKINEEFFKSKLVEAGLLSNFSDEFVNKYGYGFLKTESYKELNRMNLNNPTTDFDNNEQSFLISNLNYSLSNKWTILTVIPYHKAISKVINQYNLKALFSSIEFFIVEKTYYYLQLDPPFQKKTSIFNKVFQGDYFDDYNIEFDETSFFQFLKSVRPNLYKNIYEKYLEDQAAFEKLVSAFNNDAIITGTIIGRSSGGMIVDVDGYKTFLPGSHIDVKPVKDYNSYLDKTMQFKILNIYDDHRGVVISHRVLIEAEYLINREVSIQKLEKGATISGVVKNITNYGIFVDIGNGIDGLVHITDISWGKVDDPNDIFSIDQNITVKILDYDSNKTRIQLGIKQLDTNHIEEFSKLKIGDNVKGEISKITDYGIFVRIANGIEGLVHITEFSWSKIPKIKDPKEYIESLYTIGDEVEAVIYNISEDIRVALSIKRLQLNTIKKTLEQLVKGQKIVGKVTEICVDQAKVDIGNNVEAIINIHDIRWEKIPFNITDRLAFINRYLKVNQTRDFKILYVSTSQQLVNLGLKQLMHKDWKSLAQNLKKNMITDGKIIKISKIGAIVELFNGLEGLIYYKYIIPTDRALPKVNQHSYIENYVSVGDVVSVKILFKNYERMQITLALNKY